MARRCGFIAAVAPAVPRDFGGHSEGETPLPIPNRAVKPLSADGTWWATAWESRSPPALEKPPSGRLLFVFGELGAGPAGSETSNRPGRRGRVNGSGGPWAS